MYEPVIIVLAYVVDIVVGDPEGLPHPVRWIGRMVAGLEGWIRRVSRSGFALRLGGIFLCLIVVGIAYGVSYAVMVLSSGISQWLYIGVGVAIAWSTISIRSLSREAQDVVEALREGDLVCARSRLSRIVGRDTDGLTEDGILRAVVETVSENTSDGVVAPLFYLAIGGPPLAMAYKAINTLDSMVGYRDERYRDMGWFSARVDDLANLIPSRLTAVLMVCGAFLLGLDWRSAIRVVRRDGRLYPSPNAGIPQAVMAGALGVRLGGRMKYRGVVCEKPSLGDERVRIDRGCVDHAVGLLHIVAFMTVVLASILSTGIMVLFETTQGGRQELLITLFKFIHLLSLVVWVGSIIFFSFFAAPSIFKVLPQRSAGDVVGDIFPKYWMIGYICGVSALCSIFVLYLVLDTVPYIHVVIILAMTVIAFYSGLVIGRRAREIKMEMRSVSEESNITHLRREFRSVHFVSSILNGTVLVLGVLVIFLTSRTLFTGL